MPEKREINVDQKKPYWLRGRPGNVERWATEFDPSCSSASVFAHLSRREGNKSISLDHHWPAKTKTKGEKKKGKPTKSEGEGDMKKRRNGTH